MIKSKILESQRSVGDALQRVEAELATLKPFTLRETLVQSQLLTEPGLLETMCYIYLPLVSDADLAADCDRVDLRTISYT